MREVARTGLGLVLAVAMLAPAAGLVSAVVERSPGGEVRVEGFSLALTVFDPLVRESVGNSLLMALGVAVGSMVLGLVLAGLGRRGGRAGQALEGLGSSSVVTPILFLSLGMLAWINIFVPGDRPFPLWLRVGAWGWVELAWGVGVVLVVAREAMGRVFPIWEEAARLAGGRRWLTWRVVLRPVVLPEVMRAGGWVLAGAFFEPTAPLLLGLRRTVASRIVEAALGPGSDPVSRASALVVIVVVISALSGGIFLLWGGTRGDVGGDSRAPRPVGSRASAAWTWVGLLAMAVLTLGPIGGLAGSAWSGLAGPDGGTRGARLASWVDEVRPALADSAVLGVSASTLALAASAVLASLAPGSKLERLALWVPRRLPALAVGIGTLGLVGLLGGGSPEAAGLARWLDPVMTPGVLLVLVAASVQVPRLTRLVRSRAAFASPEQKDAARLLGGPRSRFRRWRVIQWPSAGPPLVSAWLWTALLAAFETSAALVLTPTSAFRPVGPVLLDLDGSAEGLARASVLGLVGWVAVLLGVVVFRARGETR